MRAQTAILIVDDDALILKALGRALRRRRIAVTAVGSAREALEAARLLEFHLALVDVVLETPLDGFGLMCVLRSRAPSLKIIAMSGEDSRDRRAISCRAGANEFLAKPFPMEEVIRLICTGFEASSSPPDSGKIVVGIRPLDIAEQHAILSALDACDWNLSLTARILRISRSTLQRKIDIYGLTEVRQATDRVGHIGPIVDGRLRS